MREYLRDLCNKKRSLLADLYFNDDLLAMEDLHLMTDNRQHWKGLPSWRGRVWNLQKCEKLSHTKLFGKKTTYTLLKNFRKCSFWATTKHTNYIKSINAVKFQNLPTCEEKSPNFLLLYCLLVDLFVVFIPIDIFNWHIFPNCWQNRLNTNSPIVCSLHRIQMYIIENAHSHSWQASPNCWQNISHTNVLKLFGW